MKRSDLQVPFIFFDLGQTLIDEHEFIANFDVRFLEILNGYGARVDKRNYYAIRDSIIRDRLIGSGSLFELAEQVCKLLLPDGYSDSVLARLKIEAPDLRTKLYHFYKEAEVTLAQLTGMGCELGIIANQSQDILDVLDKSDLKKFFKVIILSFEVNLRKPDERIFNIAVSKSGRQETDCIMIGDRLDTDICPANSMGMKTIRTCDSIFSLQVPQTECELPTFTVPRLEHVAQTIKTIIETSFSS